jgi:hypothetical protein
VVFISLLPSESNLCYKYSSLLKVHLLSAYTKPSPNFGPDWLRKNCPRTSHALVDNPEIADVVLFVETLGYADPYFLNVIHHPVYRTYPDKSVLYHIDDNPFTLCRTVSPSVEKGHPNPGTRRSFHYIARIRDNPLLAQPQDRHRIPRHLFSFLGDPETHPVRKTILSLQHPNAFLKAFSGTAADNAHPSDQREIHQSFIDSVLDSHFVLCPRGYGPTSMRLFEVMQLGRVPVVIGDSWEPVPNAPWKTCAVFVTEDQVIQIPSILEKLKSRAPEMGNQARKTWEHHFSPERSLDQLIDAAVCVLAHPFGMRERFANMRALCHPKHWRNLLGYYKRRILPPDPRSGV